MFFIEIEIPRSGVCNMAEIGPRPIFGLPGHPISQKFLSAQKRAFFPPLGHLPPPPFIFLIMDLWKKKIVFLFKVWTYVFGKHNATLNYLAQNGKKSTTEISQKWDFYKKKFWSLFTAVFFDFFTKIVKK